MNEPFKWATMIPIKDREPFRPFKYKIPMSMNLIDAKYQVFEYDKNLKKFNYICSTFPI